MQATDYPILDEHRIDPDPIKQFRLWFDEASTCGLTFPNAMTLATATEDGSPSARIVLLKEFDQRGFVFFTNYESEKGKLLSRNPRAALVLYWEPLARQVRIEGVAEKIAAEESDSYFQTRPRESQISALISPQSSIVSSREELENRFREAEERFRNRPVPRPPFWGGYRVKPNIIEFWQGREARLHDRIRYELQADGAWKVSRLAP